MGLSLVLWPGKIEFHAELGNSETQTRLEFWELSYGLEIYKDVIISCTKTNTIAFFKDESKL